MERDLRFERDLLAHEALGMLIGLRMHGQIPEHHMKQADAIVLAYEALKELPRNVDTDDVHTNVTWAAQS